MKHVIVKAIRSGSPGVYVYDKRGKMSEFGSQVLI